MFEDHHEITKVIQYMNTHWPSPVKAEWQVGLDEYPQILKQVLQDFLPGATKNRHLIRITGISGSGKTTQILPAAEAYSEGKKLRPILVAARRFVTYHPYYQEIKDYYGEEHLRKNTDGFSTIIMCLTLTELIKNDYDIILDLALADPEIEGILLKLLKEKNYKTLFLMIAVSAAVSETFLQGRAWRHTKATETEFMRASLKALEFYAKSAPDSRIILWSVYDQPPIYDGPIKDCLQPFIEYSKKEALPANDDDKRRDAKIKYLTINVD